ncbi:hypothetical protein [Halopelagius fulvigenes]|uniref:Small CPxCG-related zinc finger protein n=1 Tax=Halopelagius fulvigenes TaxID=1198324 RepID=A0ABD5TX78_9EURY
MSSRTSPRQRPSHRRPRVRIDPRPSIDTGPATAANARARTRHRPRTVRPVPDVAPRPAAEEDRGEFLVWYCTDCEGVGSADAFPPSCPDCSAGRRSLSCWPED